VVYLKDAGGDLALHYASKNSSIDIVSLLIPKSQKDKEIPLHQEDGVGLTPLDRSTLKLLSVFHRTSTQPLLNKDSVQVYQHLLNVQSRERVLAKGTEVNQTWLVRCLT
jgi:ankyrin repeat protein